jgi:hypothetical protein
MRFGMYIDFGQSGRFLPLWAYRVFTCRYVQPDVSGMSPLVICDLLRRNNLRLWLFEAEFAMNLPFE